MLLFSHIYFVIAVLFLCFYVKHFVTLFSQVLLYMNKDIIIITVYIL